MRSFHRNRIIKRSSIGNLQMCALSRWICLLALWRILIYTFEYKHTKTSIFKGQGINISI